MASLLAWWAQAGPLVRHPARLWPLGAAPALPADTVYRPSRRPRVAPRDRPGSPFGQQRRESPLVLPLPPSVKLKLAVDDSLKNFDVQEKVGENIDYRDPSKLTFKEYAEFQQREAIRNYYRERARGGIVGPAVKAGTPQAQRLIPKIDLGPVGDRIFGGRYVDIRPAGAVTIKAGAKFNTNENPALTLRQQSVGDFIFDQSMNINLTGQVGTKLKLAFNYDTKASFDFDNQMKFDYSGQETDILRKLDLGNVSLPLGNSLVQGGQNLFGAKAQLQFGRLGVTAVAATVRGTADEVRVQNGAQSRQFELKASQYEKDKHFFLSHFFRERYDVALRNLPTVQSGVQVTQLEVYVTNDNRTTSSLRNVVALMDIAEPVRVYQQQAFAQLGATRLTPAANNANREYGTLTAAGAQARNNLTVDSYLGGLGLAKNLDYERVRARKLDPNEYTFNSDLGYVSLNTALLPDQVLGVSYSYIYNGKTYKVGETVQDYGTVGQDQVIFLKLLRASNPGVGTLPVARPDPLFPPGPPTRNTPTWDLMMKNVYSLNTTQLNRDNFQLQIIYKDDITGVDLISLKEGNKIQNLPLIQVLGLDRVNPNNDRNPDGNFDFFPGVTVNPELGRIIFPIVQPFGDYLRAQFDTVARSNPQPPVTAAVAANERTLLQKYVYEEIYNQTQSDAQQRQEKDKFYLRGRYQGASTDEINLPGIGVAQGSVKVFSGSTLLTEGVDYQVFYDQAKVKVLNPAYLASANELRVTFEKNALVQVQPRRLLGTRFDYKMNKDVTLGGTALYLLENQAPGINRVNIGDEPANNSVVGVDGSIRKDSRVLTKLLDRLPFYSTKEISTIAFSGEFAKLLPGQSQLGSGENGTSYVDDFENARTPYTLGGLTAIPAWRLAATPSPISRATDLSVNYQRAKLAWYTVDQSYYTGGPSVPANIGPSDLSLSNHYTRGIPRNEVFPNKDLGATGNGYEYTFDMAYFPGERGPYNYTPNIDTDGRHFLNNTGTNLDTRFAGISRAITFDTDFDNANIEYLEFWLLDPFITSVHHHGDIDDSDPDSRNKPAPNNTGGRLVINLGNVSEDLLRDNNQYEFENGLPTPDQTDTTGLVRKTIWGRVGQAQFLTDAFSAAPGGRAAQDVGLDGLNDVAEQVFVGQANSGISGIYKSFADPSADDFLYHLDPIYDQNNVKILGRYKNYNGYENNSPEASQFTSTAFPDKEDLNRDNVIQDVESYHEYTIALNPTGSTSPLTVGQNYIVDKVVTPPITGSDGETVTWYQFRIPIRDPNQRFVLNGVTSATDIGYKSIRFIRMYMTGWRQPAVLRMVQPQFVANQWRRYNYPIAQNQSPNLPVNILTDADAFSISTVSVEENGPTPGSASGAQGAIPYVTPPNITRDTEYGSSAVSRIQNEQSLRLVVTNLRKGYAKGAYKNLTVNMLRYKRLRLYLHGETDDQNGTRSGDVRAFIRIGTDYTQNYYEYSIPLTLTNPSAVSQADIWPDANSIDMAFQDFIDAKSLRNRQPTVNYVAPFPVDFPNGARITVVGNPDLSAVQGCMIGVSNPTMPGSTDASNKSVTLWADELRVFDFQQDAGYAANARLNVKMADLATLTATGNYTSVGFGSIDDKAQQRSLDNVMRGDLSATIAADKLLPAQLHLRVPVLVQLGAERRSPEYDPLDPDTKLAQSLEKFTSADARAEYSKKVIDMTTTRSLSLLNVRKERVVAAAAPPGGGPPPAPRRPKPWDLENVALSYSIAERQHSDVRTSSDYTRSFTAAAAYAFQTTPKNYTPFAKFKAFDSPYLKFLQQVNFTPLPSRFAFRIDLDRRYNERFLQRVVNPGDVPSTVGIPGVYQKSFYINRIYDLSWALTKALTIDYTATNRGIIDEGQGRAVGSSQEAIDNRRLINQNLLAGGRTVNFNQTIAATYRLPLDKFPLTDWLSADARYAAHYTWQAASTALRQPLHPNSADPTDTATVPLNLGNTIQNNAELSANGRIDLVKLYNKVKFLNIINNAPPPPPRPVPPPPGAPDARPKPEAAAPRDTTPVLVRAVKAVLRSLMTARSLNFTYARSSGTLLPGYLPGTTAFGLTNYQQSGLLAPGIPFVIGKQYALPDLYGYASRNGWYTGSSEYLNTPLSNLMTENLLLRTTLEPFRDFVIQLDARRNKVENNEAYYRNLLDTVGLKAITVVPTFNKVLAPTQALGSGSFSTSTITINTLFNDLSANGEVSKAFTLFVNNRGIIQNRLALANPASVTQAIPLRTIGFYSYNSQDVLIPAFIDAYHGRSSDGYQAKKFNLFDQLPLPNWTIGYNGLSQLAFFRNYFSSFTLNHAYNSTYSVGTYTTSTLYNDNSLDFPNRASGTGQYIPYYVIGQVSIAEHLAPLIGVNFTTLNKITGRVEYRTDRLLGLNVTNAQVTELHTTALVIGFGYSAAGLKLPFRTGGEQRVLKNTLTARLDLSINDNVTIQRSILNSVDPSDATSAVPASVGTPTSQVTNGSRQLQLRPTVDYLLNTRLNLQFYYTQTITTPRVSNAFRNSNTEGGFQLRYSLTQ